MTEMLNIKYFRHIVTTMSFILFAGSVVVLSTIALYFSEQPETITEKRTYLFETQDGSQYNTFSEPENTEEAEWRYTTEHFD